MSTVDLAPAGLKRVAARDVSPRETRYLAQVDIDSAALEERWGGPETIRDDFAEWFAFAFSPVDGEAFILLREAENPPAPGFILSVTGGLFSPRAADLIVRALAVAGARVTHLNSEAG
ncbi:hypothetical protein ACWGOK_40080 [Streptomyces eurythermus]